MSVSEILRQRRLRAALSEEERQAALEQWRREQRDRIRSEARALRGR